MIDVMLSSTVKDLIRDRAELVAAFTSTGLTNVLGIEPVQGPTYSGSAYVATTDMARDCHLYVLILGGRYGFIAESGQSATELEYLTAYSDDPTKILIFRKRVPKIDDKQAEFIKRVGEYHHGYYMRDYAAPKDLRVLALLSLRQWLEDRAAIGKKLQYFDHFIRLAVQQSPFPGVTPTYEVAEDHLELKYRFLGKSYTIHFDKGHIYSDFWGSIATLRERFAEWKDDNYGRNP